MYDVMLDEANQWYQEPPLRKRKLEPSPVEEKEVQAYSSEEDMDPVEREKYRLQAVESCDSIVTLSLICLIGLSMMVLINPLLVEVKESELVDNEWIYLYAEAALFSEWRSEMSVIIRRLR
ncbi:hypothetical protein DY000_02035686 [Brassica cretica]|uniref:PGG domain-containing protein n=1 Tax=Brassica cretica TaxID=69181 RepID=A0ABQ7DYG2_BRACR|nr:hypothetical protein DY000_02035686 [Brassica cretica]